MQIHEITQYKGNPLAEVTLPTEWLGQRLKSAGQQLGKGAASVRKNAAPLAKSAGQKLGQAASWVGNTTIGNDIKNAVVSPFQKAAAVINTPGAMTSARGYGAAMDQYYHGQVAKNQTKIDQQLASNLSQQTQQRAKQLAQQWIQKAGTASPVAPNAPKAAPGQMPAAVASSKTGQNMQQMFGQPKGGIQGMQSDLEEAAPSATAQEFQTWADSQLTSRVTGSNQSITMDQVRKDPTAAKELKSALAAVAKNPADPAAVENYFMTAMTAMQKLSAQIKQQQKATTTAASGSGTQVTPISHIVTPQQIEQIKAYAASDPTKAYAVKQTFGLR
jgi:hypothetical protein